jgi:hypothetical protein
VGLVFIFAAWFQQSTFNLKLSFYFIVYLLVGRKVIEVEFVDEKSLVRLEVSLSDELSFSQGANEAYNI